MPFPHALILKQAYQIVRAHRALWLLGLFFIWGMIAKILIVKKILDRQPVGLRDALKSSRPFYPRVWTAALVLSSGSAGLLVVLVLPVVILYLEGFVRSSIILGILAAGILLPTLLILNFASILAKRFICLYDLPAREGIKLALDLTLKNFPVLLELAVRLWIRIGGAFLLGGIVVSLIVLPFILLSGNLWTGLAPGIFLLLPLELVLAGFYHTVWTLAFLELVKAIKSDDQNQAMAPAEAA